MKTDLELPVSGLEQLLGLFPGTAGGQHELIDHHLLAQRVHFRLFDFSSRSACL